MKISDYATTPSAIRLASLTSQSLAEFSEAFDSAVGAVAPIEFAALKTPPKKKICTKGVYCVGKTGKGSCVKAGSKCRSKAAKGSQDYASAIGPELGETKTDKPKAKTQPKPKIKSEAEIRKAVQAGKPVTSEELGAENLEIGSAALIKYGKPITSKQEFRDVLLDTEQRLRTEVASRDSFDIPVIRKTIGDRVSAEQFDEYMFELQSDGLIQMQSSGDSVRPGAVVSALGGSRDTLKIEQENAKPSANYKAPKLQSSMSEKEFNAALEKEVEETSSIANIRRKLGDRVTRADFNRWIHANSRYRLSTGDESKDNARLVLPADSKYSKPKSIIKLLTN